MSLTAFGLLVALAAAPVPATGPPRVPAGCTLALSPDARFLAAADPSEVSVWDLRAGRLAYQLDDASGVQPRLGTREVRAADIDVLFTPDGRYLLTCDNSGTIQIRAAGTGKPVRTIKAPAARAEPKLQGMNYSDSISRLFHGSGGDMAVFSTGTGHLFTLDLSDWSMNYSYHNWRDDVHAVSGDGRFALLHYPVDATYQEAWLTDLRAGKFAFAAEITNGVWAGAISADGKLVAGAGERVALWEVGPNSKDRLQDAGVESRCVTFTPEGKTLLAVAQEKGAVVRWDTATGKRLPDILAEGGVFTMALSGDGRRLATAGKGGTVRLFALPSGVELPIPARP